jgi:hypothetical protein
MADADPTTAANSQPHTDEATGAVRAFLRPHVPEDAA